MVMVEPPFAKYVVMIQTPFNKSKSSLSLSSTRDSSAILCKFFFSNFISQASHRSSLGRRIQASHLLILIVEIIGLDWGGFVFRIVCFGLRLYVLIGADPFSGSYFIANTTSRIILAFSSSLHGIAISFLMISICGSTATSSRFGAGTGAGTGTGTGAV